MLDGENRFLVVGLGNPTKQYVLTRHNLGFMFLDFLSSKNFFSFQSKNTYELADSSLCQKKVFFLKPMQYMNLSGIASQSILSYYKISIENLVVCYDDTAFDIGTVRIKHRGSAGGHNGLASLIKELGTDQFTRIRLGIGPKPSMVKLSDYVLGSFSASDKNILLKDVFTRSSDALEMILSEGVEKTMSLFNA